MSKFSHLDASARLKQAGMSAKKSWGQNFLQDARVLQDITRATKASPELPCVELGAGLGALTHFLVEQGGQVIAVERDREIVPLLKQQFAASPNLQVLEADAASLDYQALRTSLGAPFVVAGNLPYQLSGRILVSLSDVASDCIVRAVLLVQREVAERLDAPAGSRTYGLLSVLVQRAFATRLVRHVPPSAFHPRPKVDSAVVELTALTSRIEGTDDRAFVRTAKAAFSARRKTLRNALSGALRQEPKRIEEVLQAAGIDASTRAETLSVEDFAHLTRVLSEAGVLEIGPSE